MRISFYSKYPGHILKLLEIQRTRNISKILKEKDKRCQLQDYSDGMIKDFKPAIISILQEVGQTNLKWMKTQVLNTEIIIIKEPKGSL